MVLVLAWPLVGLDRNETASLLRCRGTFQFLTGLPPFPDPQTLRRFLLHAPQAFAAQLRRANDRLLQFVLHLPDHRSRLILDLDSAVVTTFGHQEGATLGYDPRYRGKRSYQPLLCIEAGSAHLLGAFLRPGKTDPHSSMLELFRHCWDHSPADIREVRVRSDAGSYNVSFLSELEDHDTRYAVVAQLRRPLRRILPGLSYQRVNPDWEMAKCEYRAHSWSEPRRHVVTRRLVATAEHHLTPFQLGRDYYRGWVTNLDLTPHGLWRFYGGRAAIEVRIRELREDFALANIPTLAFAANRLYLEVIRFAYNLVAAFQRICFPVDWQSFTLRTLHNKFSCFQAPWFALTIDPSSGSTKHPKSNLWLTKSSPPLRNSQKSSERKEAFFTPDIGITLCLLHHL